MGDGMLLTAAVARVIVDAALAHARRHRFAPLTIAVLASDGSILVMHREDGCAPLRCDISVGKAKSALGMGIGTRELARRFDRSPTFFSAVSAMTNVPLLPSAGGVLIQDATALRLGAVGVSGDTSDRDEECAIFGVRSVGPTVDET